MCDESRTHGATWGKIRPDYHIGRYGKSGGLPITIRSGTCLLYTSIRLAVYIKGKNAKKFRKNLEYGSARWGTAEDIKPYVAPAFENNIILTQTERLTCLLYTSRCV